MQDHRQITNIKPILYRPDIDGLRAIAISLVIIFHIWPKSITGGFIGVDVFFVISGFLITSIINKEITANTFSFASFYSRRIKRILPVFFIVVYVASVIAYFMLLPEDYRKFVNSATNAALYYSNMFFYGQNDYFALGSQEFPLLHTWSLSVEEQYYVFWPIVIFGLNKFKQSKYIQAAAITSLFLLSYLFSIILAYKNPSLGYYSILSRTFELMLGSILALMVSEDRSVLNRVNLKTKHFLAHLLSIIGIVIIIFCAVYLNDKMLFPSYIALLPTLGAALIIYAGHLLRNNFIAILLSTRVTVAIGLISYSLYLWHWPILAFWHYYYPGEEVSVKVGILIIIITVSLSILSYYFIELYFKTHLFSFKHNFIKLFLIPLIPLIIISTIVVHTKGLPQRMGNINYVLETSWIDTAKYCHGQITGNCISGDISKQGKVKVLLFGDSHAGALSPFWDVIAQNYGFKIKYYSDGGCYPLLNTINNIPASEAIKLWSKELCVQQVNNLSNQYNDFDVFIIAAKYADYFLDTSISFSFESEFNNTLSFLLKHQKRIIVVSDLPGFQDNEITKLQRNQMFTGNNKYTFIQDDNNNYNQRIKALTMNYANVYYLDLNQTISTIKTFPYMNNFLLYKDDNHLNQAGSIMLAKYFLSTHESDKLKQLFESWNVIK